MIFLLIRFYRHVQVNNESAIEFYRKFGFQIVETKDQYYKRIEPAGAHVLEKILRTDEPAATSYNNSQIGSSSTLSETASTTTTTNANTANDMHESNHLPNGIDHEKSYESLKIRYDQLKLKNEVPPLYRKQLDSIFGNISLDVNVQMNDHYSFCPWSQPINKDGPDTCQCAMYHFRVSDCTKLLDELETFYNEK